MKYLSTIQQVNYYAAGTDPYAGSIALLARAGCGKTSTQCELASRLPGSGLATSVMRSTVADLAKVMPQNWETKGLHALGYAGIRKKLKSAKVDTKGNALYEFCKEALKDEDAWWKLLPDIKALVEQSMLAGIVPNHERFATPDTPEAWDALAERFDIDMTPVVYETAHNAVIHLNKLALEGTIQFTHMLTLPLFFGFPINQYPKIIVDEAQDLNILQHLMVGKALRHNGRIFVTGDDRQAIMAFSGALSNSFHELVSKFSCKVLPLTVSWRCPRAVIEVAQRYVPDIQAAPKAIEGAVIEADRIDISELPRVVLCRNNAPLMRLAMRLFVSGFSVECAGKDISTGLKSTINRIAGGKTSDQMKSVEFMSRLQRWADREIERRPARKHSVLDKRDALFALTEHHQTVGAIRKHIDRLYVDENDEERRKAEFQLSTIHKAKGREWDRVGFLDAHLIPAKWARQDWELEQEDNLAYVGVTRAKQELIYLDSEMIQ
jgi:DNA helicase-2/ATP-dependent DNA helicase PcrA